MEQKCSGQRAGDKQALLLEEGIQHLEQELEEQYYQLGKVIYEVADHKISEINRLVDQLVEQKIKLTQARGQVACPECLALNGKESRYCCKCGKGLEADEG